MELRPGVPWSAAVTVNMYSARSNHLRGAAVLSSPLVGFREKRSALGPSDDRNGGIKRCHLSRIINRKKIREKSDENVKSEDPRPERE